MRYFGDYELLGKIAEGGMGVVWRARQISLNKKVALKMIKAGQLDSAAVARFRTEAEAMAQLDHPNIVPIYEVGEYEGQQYFSMRLVEGHDLAHEIGSKPLLPRRAAELLATVARAVHHAHQRGVLHRDLKPSNILLERADTGLAVPNVTDFGLAKLVQQPQSRGQTASVAVIGTFEYMAPEQADGKTRHLTTAADIYSLGAILYAMLTGKPPFELQEDGQNEEGMLGFLRRVVETTPPRPRTINRRCDQDLEAICLKCMEKTPADRYGSAETLAMDLERWLRGEPVDPRPVPMWRRGVMWAKRHPAVAALTASLTLAVLVGVGTGCLLWQERELQRREALQSRDEAERLARTQLNQYFTNSASGIRLYVKGDLPAARQALQTSGELIQALLANNPTKADLQILNAEWNNLWGDLLRAQGDLDGALTALQKASRTFRDLLRRDKGNASLLRRAAASQELLGTTYDSRAEHDLALASCREWQRTLRELLATASGDADDKAELGRSCRAIYVQLASQGKFDEALVALKEGLALLADASPLPDASPGAFDPFERWAALTESARLRHDMHGALYICEQIDGQMKRQLSSDAVQAPRKTVLWESVRARNLGVWGDLLASDGNIEDAETAFSNSIDIILHALERQPTNSQLRQTEAELYTHWGNALNSAQDRQGARTAHENAIAAIQRMLSTNPEDPNLLRRLGESHWRIAGILEDMGDYDGALRSLREQLKLNQQLAIDNPIFQVGIAEGYRNIYRQLASKGDCEEAFVALRDAIRAANAAAPVKFTRDEDKLKLIYETCGYLAESAELRHDIKGAIYACTEFKKELSRVLERGGLPAAIHGPMIKNVAQLGRLLAASRNTDQAMKEYEALFKVADELAIKDQGLLAEMRRQMEEWTRRK